MSRIKVAVLRGGPSSEYDVSLKTGAAVLRHLPEEKYEGLDIFIDKAGEWHFRGFPTTPAELSSRVDVFFNAMHGEYGEDGTVQKLLETFGVPYTGSAALPARVAMNKWSAKQVAKRAGIRTPKAVIIDVSPDLEREILELFRSLMQPSVIKPVDRGSSAGVTIARDFSSFKSGIAKAFELSPRVLIEEYVPGREATCGVLEGFRGEELYALFPIEIIPPSTCSFFDYDAKYSGETKELCPGNFSPSVKSELERVARTIHQALGLRHYSRSDFIVSPRGIYFLETNTLPGLTDQSLFPKAFSAAGGTFPHLLDHLLELAMRRHSA